MDEWAVRFHAVEFRRQYGFDERAFFVKALRRAGFSRRYLITRMYAVYFYEC